MQSIRSFFAPVVRDQRGLTTVEYAIVLCVIVAVAAGTWQQFGEKIHGSLEKSNTKIGEALDKAE